MMNMKRQANKMMVDNIIEFTDLNDEHTSYVPIKRSKKNSNEIIIISRTLS